MEFKVIPTSVPEWDTFYQQHSTLLFHSQTWHDVVRHGLGYPFMYYTLWEGRHLVLALPVFLINYPIIKILYASIPYGTIIGDYEALPDFSSGLADALRSQGIHLLYVGGSYLGCPHLDLPDTSPICQPIHLLSLRGISQDDIWKTYKPYVRRDIRKAERAGVTVGSIGSRSEVEDFYLLYLCSMKRNNVPAKYPKKFMYSIYDRIIALGQGDIFFAKIEGKKIAGIMVLYSQDTAHYYFGGSLIEYQKYQPNEALLHTAISHAIAMELSVFDFMGSDAHDTGLIHFKEKWGAVSHMTPQYAIVQHPLRYALWNRARRLFASPAVAALIRGMQRFRSVAATDSHIASQSPSKGVARSHREM